MYLKSALNQRLNAKLKKLNELRPISSTLLQKLKEKFEIEMTYNSNAIEGNTLTLKETYWVIQEGITVKGKPLKDHLEAKNHQLALEYLYELVEQDGQSTISEHLIKSLHSLVFWQFQRHKFLADKYLDQWLILPYKYPRPLHSH